MGYVGVLSVFPGWMIVMPANAGIHAAGVAVGGSPRRPTWIPACAGMTYDRRRILVRTAMEKDLYVYVLASRRNGTLYIGVTSALVQRVWHHKTKAIEGFTARYGVDQLVYFEAHGDAAGAIQREKQLKKWRRAWKIQLIEERNPEWRDLYAEIAS
jgi:putative endonuclease